MAMFFKWIIQPAEHMAAPNASGLGKGGAAGGKGKAFWAAKP